MTRIPSPAELGIPIDRWRDGQEEALRFMLENRKRVTEVCAPTGFGKSWVAVAFALITGEPTCIVTATRGLQDQYLEEAACVGLVDLRGRRNYTCDMRDDATCEDGYNGSCPYKGTINCPSSQAEMQAATSKRVVTNYDKWTAARRFGQGMNHFTQVIFDEGHDAPEALARAMQVQIHYKEVNEHLEMDFPDGAEDAAFPEWKRWAGIGRGVAQNLMTAAYGKIQGNNPKLAHIRHYNHMRNLTRRLAILAAAATDNWICDTFEKGYQFDPIVPARYSEAALLLRVPKIIFISATIRPKTMYMCGIGKDDFEFREFKSDFDPKRCPIYYVPTMRVDRRSIDNSQLWTRLDQIAAKRQDRKGIVHTVSYGRRDEIRAFSRFASNMMFNEKGEAPTECIDLFRESPPGTILVSPSVGTGYDFKYQTCEWQFMCKIPFQPPSRIVKAREEKDQEYRGYMAMQALVQAFGRGMRSWDDRCESFIADDHMQWFYKRYAHLAPASFHGFYREVQVLPQPPERL